MLEIPKFLFRFDVFEIIIADDGNPASN